MCVLIKQYKNVRTFLIINGNIICCGEKVWVWEGSRIIHIVNVCWKFAEN